MSRAWTPQLAKRKPILINKEDPIVGDNTNYITSAESDQCWLVVDFFIAQNQKFNITY